MNCTKPKDSTETLCQIAVPVARTAASCTTSAASRERERRLGNSKTSSVSTMVRASAGPFCKFVISAVVLLAACSTVNMWIPLTQSAPHAPVSYQQVQYLQTPPDRPYEEIGIITPPADEYETEAEAIMAIRKEAAKHGANAIFIESQNATSGWSFSGGPFGASGGATNGVAYRAKAIVWK